MKKLHILSIIFSLLLFLSFSGSHPTGRSGAPGDGLCSDCHSGGGGFSGEISIAGVPADPIPGQVYDVTMTLDVTGGNPIRGGFQVVSLRSLDDTQAGTWSNPDGSSSLKTSGGRVYFGHQPFRSFGGNPSVSWDAEWEAPDITDEVIFYMAGNFANGNGSSSGDLIVSDQFSVDIVSVDPIEVDFIEIVGVTCNGDSDGVAVASASGGVAPYDYEWDNGETGDEATELTGGNHNVTVTDDNGASVVASVEIPEPDEIQIEFEALDPTCFGSENGIIIVEAFGGTGDLECTWVDFGNDCTIEDLGPGIYELTVVDENGCSFTMEFELEEPEELELTMSSTDATAGNSDGTATCEPMGGTPPYLFDWSNGESEEALTSTITDLPPGGYFVTVTDDNGCRLVGEIDVDGIDCNIQTSIAGKDVSCYNGNDGSAVLTVTGASQPVTYNWSNGVNTKDINNLSAAWYFVTVTDADQCVAVDSVEIMEPDSISIDSSMIMMVECPDDSTGAIYVFVSGGTAPYSYFWSNGLTNDTIVSGMDFLVNPADSIDGLGVGLYHLTVMDANACTQIDSFAIEAIDMEAPSSETLSMNAFLNENGVAMGPDVALVQSMISDNCAVDSINYVQEDYSCNDLGEQLILFLAFDEAGNSSISEMIVNVMDNIAPEIECPFVETTINSCSGFDYTIPVSSDNCAVVELTQNGGLPSGSVFPEGETVMEFIALDAAGNTAACVMTVNVELDLDVVANTIDASCDGNDGSVELLVTGGTAPYTIEPPIFENLSPGDYDYTITDANGCIVEINVIIGQVNNDIEYDISVVWVTCFGGNDGMVSIEFADDPANYDVDYGMNVDPGQLAAGIYSVTITELATNCVSIDQYEIPEPEEFVIQNVELEQDICTGNVLDVDVETQGGWMPVSSIEYEETDSSIVITAVDNVGCVAMETIELEIPDPIVIDEYAISTDPCTGEFIDIEVDVSGGTMPYSIDVNAGGGFLPLVTITDANGCVLAEVFPLDSIDDPLVLVDFSITALNGGSGLALVEAIIEGGTEPYSYVWTDETGVIVSTEAEVELPNGTYNLEITDALGCVLQGTVVVDIIDSVDDVSFLDRVDIYPNPANDILNIELEGDLRNIVLELYDLNGKIIFREKTGSRAKNTIDLSDLEQGLYLLVLEQDNNRFYRMVSKI